MNSYDIMRTRWFDRMVFNQVSDDEIVKERKHIFYDKVEDLWAKVHKGNFEQYGCIWPDLFKPEDLAPRSSSSFIKITYRRLAILASGYHTIGCSLHKKEEVKTLILKAIDYMYETHYHEHIDEWYGNSFNWDIGSPLGLTDLFILMYDFVSNEQIAAFCRVIDHYIPAITTSTGANRIWKARILALRGIIEGNDQRIQYAREAIEPVFHYVTKGDGFYKDGSFIQHTFHPYTGGYGISLMGEVVPLIHLLSHTPWSVNEEKMDMLHDWFMDSFVPVVHRGLVMDSVRGRGTGQGGTDQHTGFGLMNMTLELSEAVDATRRELYQGIVKHWLLSDPRGSFLQKGNIGGVVRAKAVLGNEQIQPIPMEKSYAHMAKMDRYIQHNSEYAVSIAPHSARIRNYEITNRQNLKGWHTGDGMTYIYQKDIYRYGDAFWLTVDPHRLPGTTAIYGEEIINGKMSECHWVGGSYMVHVAAIGMELHPFGSPLHARKSCFLLDEGVVCLGAGIHVDGEQSIGPVNTTVENMKLSREEQPLTVDGQKLDISLRDTIRVDTIKWAHLAGEDTDSDIGYYFPQGEQIWMKKAEESGSKWDICQYDGKDETVHTRSYMTLWFDHGIAPVDAKYAYYILPGKNPEEMEAFADKPSVHIIENSSKVQAVEDTRHQLLALNFWEPGELHGIQTDSPCSIIIQKDGEGIKQIAIADPTHLRKEIRIRLPKLKNLEPHDLVRQEADEWIMHTEGLEGQSIVINGL